MGLLEHTEKLSRAVVLMDFDECLVVEHASQQVTKALLGPLDAASFSDVSPTGILRLLDRYVGIPKDRLDRIVREVAATVTLKAGAADMLKNLVASPAITPIIVSSGLDLVIQSILDDLDLSISVVACSLSFSGGVCSGGQRAISAACKGALALESKRSRGVERVVALGHSRGDIQMLEEADLSIVVDPVSPEARAIAHWYAPSLEHAHRIIVESCAIGGGRDVG